jgi:hypothetical protein
VAKFKYLGTTLKSSPATRPGGAWGERRLGVKLGLLTLREEHRLRVFENGVLRRIFGPKRDEVTGGMEEVAQ